MRNRAIGTLILSAAVIAAATGCSNNSSAGGSTGTTVTWASVTSEKPGVEAVAAAFEAKTGIRVQPTTADVSDYQTTTRTQLASGTAPDVFFV